LDYPHKVPAEIIQAGGVIGIHERDHRVHLDVNNNEVEPAALGLNY
jgi:hypothetical protein